MEGGTKKHSSFAALQLELFRVNFAYPPAQNQYMQEKNLGELIFPRIHAGPVFALAQIQENILEESFSAYWPNS